MSGKIGEIGESLVKAGINEGAYRIVMDALREQEREILELQEKLMEANSELIENNEKLATLPSCLRNAEPGEPVFVLRAQDRLASQVVRHWENLACYFDVPREKRTGALEIADAMEKWPNRKIPD